MKIRIWYFTTEPKHHLITEKIIGAAYNVHNTLGSGFLEKVYQNSLAIELQSFGFIIGVEKPIKVYYKSEVVGNYIADIIVNEKVILEIKAIKELSDIHEVQLVNYLKATGIEVGLLINFGTSVQVKRRVMDKQN
ncbi:MAG: PD-(D/E)XK nuclease superfamily protein [Candidatus Argoarchaeum ethanivorans]|uniref:PD-(D/E)XK nuclease superfamily protein n=1 Tax=Candidatus Argoarchaeum ethanivorans TaxID=2608793 RepID=A0A811TJS5_9EURY|nr:MAG: PD-(D/E)XK nuclease superfamily protein [Candidatus Argoarchaeum ethanivorans]